MKSIFLSGALVLGFIFGASAQSKSDKDLAREKGREAIRLMDDGDFEKSIKLLEEAQKLDPKDYNYPYELGYAYYSQQDYKKALKYFQSCLKLEKSSDQIYQMIGNTQDLLGDRDAAIETYEAGLKKCPGSGSLHLEMGNMFLIKEQYNEALGWYEKGIQVEPNFASNYYWASKLYCHSDQEVYGMIYGEIFQLKEPGTKRTSEISKLMFDTYKSEITFPSDSTYSVSFCSSTVNINVSSAKDLENFKLPFGLIAYEPTLSVACIGQKEISVASLNQIRSSFVDVYFQMKHNENYPVVLFDYQNEAKKAGHFEAYNYWLLSSGNMEEFEAWKEKNTEKWEAFAKWFNDNRLTIKDQDAFYSSKF